MRLFGLPSYFYCLTYSVLGLVPDKWKVHSAVQIVCSLVFKKALFPLFQRLGREL